MSRTLKPFLAAVVAVLIVGHPESVLAWDCKYRTMKDHLLAADHVFEGTVEQVRFVGSPDVGEDAVVVFRVNKRYKGNAGKKIEIRTGTFPIGPGYPFVCGGSYTVYAYKKAHGVRTGVRTDRCTPTRPIDKNTPSADVLEDMLYGGNSSLDERQKNELLRKLECK